MISGRSVLLRARPAVSPDLIIISAEAGAAQEDWGWLEHYLALDEDLDAIVRTFPADAPLGAALKAHPGLRLLRQEPWECLASFICSSTKQIVQIQEIIRLLSARYGERVPSAHAGCPAFSFPKPEAIAAAEEKGLRECKLGFRAPYLWKTAQMVVSGELDLARLHRASTPQAREALITAPGVGRKIADCVLLFSYGRQDAFPVDVWVRKVLHQLYFPKRRKVSAKTMETFPLRYFGANAGYAQQYLFHYARTHLGRDFSGTK